MEILEISVDEIVPYENNPRKNDGLPVEKVAASIKEYGFKVPLVLSKGNVIVTGHTRLKAAKMLGLEKVPCVLAEDLTEDQAKAFRIADNKVSDYSMWDYSKLEEELKGIMALGEFDFEEFDFEYKLEGFEQEEVEEFEEAGAPGEAGDIEPVKEFVLVVKENERQYIMERYAESDYTNMESFLIESIRKAV